MKITKMLMKMELTMGKRVGHSLPIRQRNRRFPHLQEAISLTLPKSNQSQPLPLLMVKKVQPHKNKWSSTRAEVRTRNGSSKLMNPRRIINHRNNSLLMRNRKRL